MEKEALIRLATKTRIGKAGLILLGYRGSRLHGLEDEGSDIDMIGVVVYPPSHYIGLERLKLTREYTRESQGRELDIVIYELQHYVRQLLKGNPNVISTLFMPDSLIEISTKHWMKIRENRDIFLAKSAYAAYVGYARSHLCKAASKSGREDEYNGKALASALRVISEGIELFTKKEIKFPRPDADELRRIRKAEVPWEDVAGKLEHAALEFEQYAQDSDLPDVPDYNRADQLVQDILRDFLSCA